MDKLIKWTGKNTACNIFYKSSGKTYKDLYDNIVSKYEDKIIGSHAYNYKLAEINGYDADEIINFMCDEILDYDKFEELDERTDLKELSEEDYKNIISSSTGNAYYQDFEECYYFDPLDTDKIEDFDINELQLKEDEYGYYVNDINNYKWLVELNNAIHKLEDYNIDVKNMLVNEYQEYIDKSNEL